MMNKKHWLGVMGAGLAIFGAATAYASISREGRGLYVWQQTTIKDSNGNVLRVIGDDPNIRYEWNYVDTIGRYGGGDTASGRLLAKSRAIYKAVDCTIAFHTYGLFNTMSTGGSYWSKYCGVAPRDPDVRVMAEATAYFSIDDLTRTKWCGVARSAAASRGVSGTVYLSGNIKVLGDASGTEADEWHNLGSYAGVPCY